MANNLFISYDLRGPNRDYQPIFAAIFGLGQAVHLELSQFYVNSMLDSLAAILKLQPHLQDGDRLLVIDSTNNNAHWLGIPDATGAFIQQHWSLRPDR